MAAVPAFCVVADDLTGALDTAAPFAAHGWRTRVVPWPGGAARARHRALRRAVAAASTGGDVIVVDTASRHVAAGEAGRRVREAIAAASAAPRPRSRAFAFYKKIDSTLRGNLAAELAAFHAATGVARVPIAPAFPAQGRVTRGGAVFVDGQPLRRSAAARDVRGPAASGDVAALLPGGLEVLDAATDADLRRIARSLARTGRLRALAGSGGLAAALAATLGSSAHTPQPRVAGGVLVVSGSAHPAAHAQVRALAAGGTLALVVPADGRRTARELDATVHLAGEALRSGRSVALIAPPLAGRARVTPRAAGVVAARLAGAVRRLVTTVPVGALMIVGGDTTAAIVAEMGWAPLAVAGTLQPGVALVALAPPSGRARASAEPAWLVTKSGAFGDAQTLRRLLRRLTHPRPRRRDTRPSPSR
jgi:uncharacterized protein YgbK (DUF1537 family)